MRWRPDSPSIYLPNSGQIDLNAIGVEAGQTNNSQTALNDAAVRDLIGKAADAQNAMSEYYGASSSVVDITSEACVGSEWSSGTTLPQSSNGVSGLGSGWGELSAWEGGGMYGLLNKTAGKAGSLFVVGTTYIATWTVQVKGDDSRNNGCYFGLHYDSNISRGHIGYQNHAYYRRSETVAKLWLQNTIGGMPTSWTTVSGTTEFTPTELYDTGAGIQLYSGGYGRIWARNYSIVVTKK